MPSADPDPTLAELLAAVDRFRDAVEALPGRAGVSSSFAALAHHYGEDAIAEEAGARRLSHVASLLLAVAVALAVVGIVDARAARELHYDRFGAYGLVSVVVMLAAAVVFHQAVGHRRSKLEARRMQRQLQALVPYLAELPQPLRELLYGALAASLFPPLASDEPWRQPRWPEPSAMLDALRTPASLDAAAGDTRTSPGGD